MIGKRPREELSSSTAMKSSSLSIPLLMDELQAAVHDQHMEHEYKAKFIKEKLDQMTDEERLRFEFFMQSHFNRHYIRDLISRGLKPKDRDYLNDDIVILISGLTKLFVGEVVDRAMAAMEAETRAIDSSSENQGLRKHHIEEAYRQLKQEGKIGYPPERSYLFAYDNITYDALDVADDIDPDLILGEQDSSE